MTAGQGVMGGRSQWRLPPRHGGAHRHAYGRSGALHSRGARAGWDAADRDDGRGQG